MIQIPKLTRNFATLLDEVEIDIKELRIEKLDLVLLHEPCETMESTIDAYRQLEAIAFQHGKARAIGVSNFDIEMLNELMSSNTTRYLRLVCTSPAYKLSSFSVVLSGIICVFALGQLSISVGILSVHTQMLARAEAQVCEQS